MSRDLQIDNSHSQMRQGLNGNAQDILLLHEASISEKEIQRYRKRLSDLYEENNGKKEKLRAIEQSLLWQLGKFMFYLERRLKRLFTFKRQSKKKTQLPNATIVSKVDNCDLQTPKKIIEAKLADFGYTLENLKAVVPGVVFLAPFKGSGGGMNSIVQEVYAMQKLGFKAKVAAPLNLRDFYLQTYSEVEVFLFYSDPYEILDDCFGICIATYFSSVELLEQLWLKDPSITCGYYVQDYEPWFFHGGTEWERRAYRSYGRIPGMIHFAKTQFLCETLKERHGLECHLIEPSLDHTVFKSPGEEEKVSPPLVVAMIRPKTPWRQPQKTMAVLGELKKQMGTNISITTFGCDLDELFTIQPEEPFQFTHVGVLSGEEVAALFRRASIFLDLSVYQGFGRTGLEAMASGCVPILPENSGPSTYAVQRQNALLINTGDEKAAVDAAMELLKDSRLWDNLAQAGLVTAKSFSPELTALSQVLLFHPKADVLGNTDPN